MATKPKAKSPDIISAGRFAAIMMDCLCETVCEADVVKVFEEILCLELKKELAKSALSPEDRDRAAQRMSKSMAESVAQYKASK